MIGTAITRRGFLQQASLISAGAATQMQRHAPPPLTKPVLDPDTLAPFIDALPIPEIAKASGTRPSPANASVRLPYYEIRMREIEAKIHRDVKPTRMWSCGAGVPGPTFETRSGSGVLVAWGNDLPQEHFLPIDHKLMGAEPDKPHVRTVMHLHGAKAPPVSDGYPENWYPPGHSATYHYPNEQDAALLWYHDHAMGINRLNMYAGLFGLFVVRDEAEDALDLPKGEYEIPLVIFDRLFTREGQLYYPVSRVPDAPWIPELFGNAVLVNGKLFPYVNVEPRHYRLRILNGANGRFLRLALGTGETFEQIGADQGLLSAPAPLKRVLLAPAERCDLIVDFSRHSGGNITLTNDESDILQFRVGRGAQHAEKPTPARLRAIEKMSESSAIKTRDLPLVELDDVIDEPMVHLLNGKRWHEPVTENPTIDTTEIWSLINLTDDTHPIHLHLVRFQILDRRPFDVTEYLVHKRVRYVGAAVSPEPNEAGWKDTVRATPGAVTRIIIRFEGFTGRYVWHCHILEHEDNEMMRPYDIIATASGAKAHA